MTPVQGLAMRCILPGFEGATAPDWVRHRAAEGLGGVALFGRNVESRDLSVTLYGRTFPSRSAA